MNGRALGKRPLPGGERIAVVYIQGIITTQTISGGPFGGSTAGIRGVVDALRRVEEDPAIKAVVLRLDSPGGSAAASQEVAAQVERVKKAGKKVVVSMGDVAASGAYWIAAGADRIVADPATVTGSIGVLIETIQVTGLYGKIGVNKEVVKSGPFKDMGSESRPMTAEERTILQKMVDDIYDQFVDRVAQGRNMRREQVLVLADGRVFTGRQAKSAGLVDELGDFRDAVREAGRLAGIKGEPEVTDLGPTNFWDFLTRNMTGRTLYPADMLPAWLLCSPLTQR
ncbi:MAG: signal peptide peptidase SppA [Ammonifex sp.]|nr:MAG: signal peptide peptidase SppA [Ammonifex sp.]